MEGGHHKPSLKTIFSKHVVAPYDERPGSRLIHQVHVYMIDFSQYWA